MLLLFLYPTSISILLLALRFLQMLPKPPRLSSLQEGASHEEALSTQQYQFALFNSSIALSQRSMSEGLYPHNFFTNKIPMNAWWWCKKAAQYIDQNIPITANKQRHLKENRFCLRGLRVRGTDPL